MLNGKSSVLAIISHYECHQWLEQCIRSIALQSRSPDAIVVLDDASSEPPLTIVRKFPQVTLLVADRNLGPFSLHQTLIMKVDYDAYLFQDSDDWSHPDRLRVLLQEAERSRADLVGCQMKNVAIDAPDREETGRPADPLSALLATPGCHPMLFPTLLVSSELVRRIGGFATGMRLGGDTEFIHRALLAGNAVNIPQVLYYRRLHNKSLTCHPDTGIGSPRREAEKIELVERSGRNVARYLAGEAPDLTPFRVSQPGKLSHVLGPALRLAPGASY